ncbi:hypothetical protein SNE40_020250 [Patella caerulea]|uniref:Rhodopsin n=1 Tax=Patella caerulea TaxID=87958 RepID=A0AAN8G758_PATCE
MKKWKKDYKKGKIPAGSVPPWKTPGYSAQGNYPHHGGAVHHNVTNPYPQQQGGHYPPPAGYAPPPSGYPAGSVPGGYPAGSVPGGYPPGNVPGGYPPQQQYNPGGFTAPGQCPPPSNAPGYPPTYPH